MIAAALPYFAVFRIGPLPSYGPIVLAALVLGAVAMVEAARRYQLPTGELAALAAVLVVASAFGAHFFDVIANQREDAARNVALWWRFWQGISLFGAIAAIAIVTPAWASARKLPLAKLADCVALGWLVALVIGRIGCALVHDHVGSPTTLPIGIDFPDHALPWQSGGRRHDLGFEELIVAIPLCVVMAILARRLRPGLTAIVTALAYAPIRFGLDFLRLPAFDPRYAGLTAAQWGCIAMAAVAIYALARRRLA